MSDLIIVGDQAWTESEWQARERRLAQKREYGQRPEVKARRAAYWREYRKRRGESLRAYNTEWKRRNGLHSMSDADLAAKLALHQRLVDRYRRELNARARKAA